MTITPSLRSTAALVAATATAVVAALGLAAPAQAAALGTLTLNSTGGAVALNPMFTSATTSAACPTGYGTNAALKVGRAGGPYNNLRPLASTGGYDQAPFALAPNRSFQTAVGAGFGDGDWVVVVECAGQTTGTFADRFETTITVSGTTWEVKGSPGSQPAVTATTLAVSPAGPVTAGTAVTLTANVTPAAAAGSVTFRDGSTSVGTATVNGGTAAVSVSSLAAGAHSLTAVFTPSDAAAFQPSTSTASSLQVNAAAGVSAGQQLSAQVAGGGLTLALAGNAVDLTGGTVGGRATGALRKATVTDARGDNAGWNLVGQVTPFAATPGGTIPADQLGWTPAATRVNGSGTVAAGAASDPGAGLGTARNLCSAGAGASAGTFECTAGLALGIPVSTAPGTYTATLTLTLS